MQSTSFASTTPSTSTTKSAASTRNDNTTHRRIECITSIAVTSFWTGTQRPAVEASPVKSEEAEQVEDEMPSVPDDWAQALAPSGTETRLGDAIKFVLDRELANPLAGIVVLSDGRSNAGLDPRARCQ